MFNFCSTYNIKSIHQWIPFEQNELNDHYNRINDTDNWVIYEGSLELVRNFYDPFWIDRSLILSIIVQEHRMLILSLATG